MIISDNGFEKLSVKNILFKRSNLLHKSREIAYYESDVLGSFEEVKYLLQLLVPWSNDGGWMCEVRTEFHDYHLWSDVHDHYTPEDAVQRALDWIMKGTDEDTINYLNFIKNKIKKEQKNI